MNNDPIVEEIHKVREAYAEKFDNSLHRFVKMLAYVSSVETGRW